MSVRRLLGIITIVAVPAVISVWAAERATFILTSGEQKSGTLVAHGSQGNNLIDGYLNLGDGGSEQTFPQQQVAAIDFTGGTPPQNELQALPAGGGQLLVLRNGSTHAGTFENIVNGDTVLWRGTDGQQQRFAARDVSRIYLNADVARQVFHYTPTQAVATSGTQGSATLQNADIPPNGIRVDAKQWTDTGITVRKGNRLVFHVSGQVQFGPDLSHVAGADGNPAVQVPGLPVPIMGVGGLIGKIGDRPPFAIGNNTQSMYFNDTGRLMLSVNDTDLSDNNGYFVVAIQRR